MIRCSLGEIEFNGPKNILKAELSTIIYAVKYSDILSEDDINECVEEALNTSSEELKEESNELVDKLKKIIDILEG